MAFLVAAIGAEVLGAEMAVAGAAEAGAGVAEAALGAEQAAAGAAEVAEAGKEMITPPEGMVEQTQRVEQSLSQESKISTKQLINHGLQQRDRTEKTREQEESKLRR